MRSSRTGSWRLRLMNQPSGHERVEGVRGNRKVPPPGQGRGLAGKTWFPARERAGHEGRSYPDELGALGQPQDRTRDDKPLDLARALVDLRDLRVAVVALDWELAGVPVATEDLDGFPGLAPGHCRGEELRLRTGLTVREAAISEQGGAPGEEPGGIDFRRHVSELPLDRLEICDPLPELMPLERIRLRHVEGRLGDSDRLRRDTDAAAVERCEGDRHPTPLLAEEAVNFQPDSVEDEIHRRARVQAELFGLAARLEPFRATSDEETRDSGLGAGENQDRARVTAVRRPLLPAGEAPAVPVGPRASAERSRVRACLRLGQRERAERLTARQRWHEALSLLLGPELDDRERRGTRMNRHRYPHPRVGTRQLFQHEDIGDEVGPRSAEFLGDANAHQPEE